jgi:hypothetical protein
MYAYNVNNNNNNAYAVSIENDKGPFYNFTIDDETYFTLPDNSTYKIKLTNNTTSNVDATIKIDGLNVGMWRLYPNYSFAFERPLLSNREFKFVKEVSAYQSQRFGVVQTAQDNGLIEVIFVPGTLANPNHSFNHWNEYVCDNSNNSLNAIRVERKSNSDNQSNSSVDASAESCIESSSSSMPYNKGATVLGNVSAQKFYTVESLIGDFSKQVTMKVRLLLAE